MAEVLRVAQIGCGVWGKNLLRELALHPCVRVELVIDPSPEAQSTAQGIASRARLACSLLALEEHALDAVVIATPGPLHAAHARAALDRNLHVLVEKPMTTSASDAASLVSTARERGLVGMVGHLLLHHPAVVALLTFARAGLAGKLKAFRSDRFSSTGLRDVDGSLLWSLAPHDLSVLRALDPSSWHLLEVSSRAGMGPGSSSSATMLLQTDAGLRARINLKRGHPTKVRTISVEGDRGRIVFDDILEGSEKLFFVGSGEARRVLPFETSSQPLALEVDEFVRAILERRAPRTDFAEGLAVVSMVEEASRLKLLASPLEAMSS